MLQDIAIAKRSGAKGLVLGALNANGQLDTAIMGKLIQAARPLPVTLHRAFDLTADPFETLLQAQALEIDRILTSGQAITAEKGLPLLEKLVRKKPLQLTIMPGAGINSKNLTSILKVTGAREFHVSAGGARDSNMTHRPSGISMGHRDAPEYLIQTADPHKIQNLRYLADQFQSN